jgi:hypothetical protein
VCCGNQEAKLFREAKRTEKKPEYEDPISHRLNYCPAFPKHMSLIQKVLLVSASISQESGSCFKRARGWIHGILASVQNRD